MIKFPEGYFRLSEAVTQAVDRRVLDWELLAKRFIHFSTLPPVYCHIAKCIRPISKQQCRNVSRRLAE